MMPGISLTLDNFSQARQLHSPVNGHSWVDSGFGQSLAASLAETAGPMHEVQQVQRAAVEDDEPKAAHAQPHAQGSSDDAQRLPGDHDQQRIENDVDETEEQASSEEENMLLVAAVDVQLAHNDEVTRAGDGEREQFTQTTQQGAAMLPLREGELRENKGPQERPSADVIRVIGSDTSESAAATTEVTDESSPAEVAAEVGIDVLALQMAAARESADMELQSGERMDPIAARVVQIETGIRLENATGQAASVWSEGITQSSAVVAMGAAAMTGDGVNNGGEQSGTFSQPENVDEGRFAGRIVRGLTAMINQRGGSMTMRLDPPELGSLRVQMTIARGVVTAQFTASTAQAHALLEKNMATLRAALESQGLTVDRLNVQSAPASSSQEQAMNEQGQDKTQHQHDAGDGQSRGRRDEQQGQASADELIEFASFAGLMGLANSDDDLGGTR